MLEMRGTRDHILSASGTDRMTIRKELDFCVSIGRVR